MYISNGILKMKVPLCLSRDVFVEVGLREKGFGLDSWLGLGSRSKRGEGVENEGTLRRLIYVRTLSTFLLLHSTFHLLTSLLFPFLLNDLIHAKL